MLWIWETWTAPVCFQGDAAQRVRFQVREGERENILICNRVTYRVGEGEWWPGLRIDASLLPWKERDSSSKPSGFCTALTTTSCVSPSGSKRLKPTSPPGYCQRRPSGYRPRNPLQGWWVCLHGPAHRWGGLNGGTVIKAASVSGFSLCERDDLVASSFGEPVWTREGEWLFSCRGQRP